MSSTPSIESPSSDEIKHGDFADGVIAIGGDSTGSAHQVEVVADPGLVTNHRASRPDAESGLFR